MNGTYDVQPDHLIHPNILDWPLINDTTTCLSATAAYLFFVLVIGPNFMKDRKPFRLRITMMMHNLLLCLVNGWVFVESGRAIFFKAENWNKCLMPGEVGDPYVEARFTYAYYMTKYIDWIDTIFFVLRKKNANITTLHLYHHTVMPFCMLLVVRKMPGGHTSILPFLNSLIHVLMYSYYFLAAFGPKLQPYLWWKKYLTRIQMIQFMVGASHLSLITILHPTCAHPQTLVYGMITQAVIFLLMFARFYVIAYVKVKIAPKKNDLSEKEN